MTIGERIKQERIDQGLSQQELAERLGKKSKTSVCRVETNVEDLTTTRVLAYAKALGVPVEKLVKDSLINDIVLTDEEKNFFYKLRHIDRTTYENILTLVDSSYEKFIARSHTKQDSLKG